MTETERLRLPHQQVQDFQQRAPLQPVGLSSLEASKKPGLTELPLEILSRISIFLLTDDKKESSNEDSFLLFIQVLLPFFAKKETFLSFFLQSGIHYGDQTRKNQMLFIAVREKLFAKIQDSIEQGAHVNARDAKNRRLLHWAVQSGNLEVIQYLIKHGAKINARDLIWRSPLHWAIQLGNFEVVEYLIKQNADLAAKNGFGQTPMNVAISFGKEDIIKLLIQEGAPASSVAFKF